MPSLTSRPVRARRVMSLGLAVVAAMLSIGGTASADDFNFLPVADISVDAPQQLVGGTANLTASTMFFDVPLSPTAGLKIWDMTTNKLVKQCNANTCTAPVTQFAPTTHAYRAYIADWGSGLNNVVASSSPVSVTWSSTIGSVSVWLAPLLPTDVWRGILRSDASLAPSRPQPASQTHCRSRDRRYGRARHWRVEACACQPASRRRRGAGCGP